MRYVSTRGGGDAVGFEQAVMTGLADDGGLLVPESIPRLDEDTLRRWAGLSFAELAAELLALFAGEDLSRDELANLVGRAYAGFDHPEITPLVRAGSLNVLELFHGPTLAFKDVALQLLGNLFEHFLGRDGGRLNILGATSGDTGSAAIYGTRGRAGIHIFILHPRGRVSPVQERQMTSVLDDNVHNIAIEGTFDDAQRIVKNLFGDLSFKHARQLGAVNSINWARIAAQISYYFHCWGQLSGGDTAVAPVFAVPTGNFGDIFAGWMARQMGLPVGGLILATNRNDILSRFVASGRYEAADVHPTFSPAMDIQVSSNFERYLYYLMDADAGAVARLMAGFSATGRMAVTEDRRNRVRQDFLAGAASEEETLATLREVRQRDGYLLDPHTAVAVTVARKLGRPDAICLATAHPAKFGEAVHLATGEEVSLPPAFADLMERPTRCEVLPATEAAVRAYMERVLDGAAS